MTGLGIKDYKQNQRTVLTVPTHNLREEEGLIGVHVGLREERRRERERGERERERERGRGDVRDGLESGRTRSGSPATLFDDKFG